MGRDNKSNKVSVSWGLGLGLEGCRGFSDPRLHFFMRGLDGGVEGVRLWSSTMEGKGLRFMSVVEYPSFRSSFQASFCFLG